ncbi:hypothetical protein [Bacteroidetes bacterium endosymbiont of Geopemphigus sp.]|nr:hypothetical protein [Bacteroidetes bacterium endosymbiont of Geopemphigus sp.]
MCFTKSIKNKSQRARKLIKISLCQDFLIRIITNISYSLRLLLRKSVHYPLICIYNYEAYKKEDQNTTERLLKEIAEKFPKDKILPKVDLLKAMIAGKIYAENSISRNLKIS